MASSKELRRRIKSVKNTSQITKAMQMVSATKMRKAQTQAITARPYWRTLLSVISEVSGKIDPAFHPLLYGNNTDKSGVVVLSTDKGLCGSLNTNVFRKVMGDEFGVWNRKEEVIFYSVGRKGREFIVRSGRKLEADFQNPEKVGFVEAVKIRKLILPEFLNGKVGKVFLTYPRFISTLRQEARVVQLLPVTQEAIDEVLFLLNPEKGTDTRSNQEFVFEPGVDQVLDYALIHLLDTRIYQALLETKASEHSARMMAMQNATDNAKELVSDLTLTYNQMRQDAITRELLEITSAAAALS